ncbi:BQ2448_871 [Microbotryum intermedium]|uniref:BQ2448_871 protein n=1 Tax=Microbotryum intermedium TaxID=269621 RepID=A0A238F3S0_9BASI|nr:BQ2448_871 [Microbotryum intermedium]
MQHIPEFLTGARYQATDSLKPSWSAAYDIESVALFSHPSYTHLRAHRSPREGALVVRLETLDRRICEKLDQTSAPPRAEQAPQFVLTIADDRKGELKAFEGVKGWRRSHRHEVYDSLNITHGKGVQNQAPKFAVIHEFDDESYIDTDAFKQATEGRKEVRRWKLYKATPNTAPAKQ